MQKRRLYLRYRTCCRRLRRAFLLLELLVATVIIGVTGVHISRSFSQEIKMFKISKEKELLLHYGRHKLIEIEKEVKQFKSSEDIEEFESSGTIEENKLYNYEAKLNPIENVELYEIDLWIKTKNNQLQLKKWLRIKFNKEAKESSDEDVTDEELME